MELFRVTLQLESSLITPLKGDTIWGHIVWGIANHEGDSAVDDFLSVCKTEEPPLIVSSAFPHGTICRPIPRVQKREKTMTPDKYAEIKKNKKLVYADASLYFDSKSTSIDTKQLKNPFEDIVVTHNSINRFSNTVIDGSLYAVSETWAKNSLFDLYILSTFDASRVKQLCEWAFENGFGADSSIGKGVISVTTEPVSVQPKAKTNTYMALAPFVVSDWQSISDLHADTFIRNGKIGGAFSAYMQPWKKSVLLFNEGAIFKSQKDISFIGNILTDIHTDARVCQSGFAPVIPIVED